LASVFFFAVICVVASSFEAVNPHMDHHQTAQISAEVMMSRAEKTTGGLASPAAA
jgi:hypothetical protein